MRWIPATAMLTLIVALSTPAAARAFTLEPLGSAAAPIFLTSEPADPNRLYVVERAGTIRRLGAPGIFLDITPQVSGGGERGLLSMAFAPDYATSGRFYVFHTDPGGDLTVAEYHRASAESADPASRRVVLVIEHSAQANHNGGQLAFGPDGYLYVATGDGGGSSDPMANGQNLGVLLGKILRIDPRPAGGAAYAVPPGNPFAGTPGAAPEIWAYGFRNPWRFSFDRATGDLIVADVGAERVGGDRLRAAGRRGRPGRELRLELLRGARGLQPGVRHGGPGAARPAAAAHRRLLRHHRRLRRPRPRDPRARRPLRLQRLLRARAALGRARGSRRHGRPR